MSSHIAESLTNISDTISFIKNGAIEFSLLKPDFESLMDRINSGSGTRPFELP